ncbi:MAG: hypothetical protein AAB874_04510 [Patescibacteria group bacterium]
MLAKISKSLKNILFPPFSELEFITLIYICLLVVIENWQTISKIIRVDAVQLVFTGPWDEQIKSLLLLVIIFIAAFLFIASIVVNAFHTRKVSLTERKTYAAFFYAALSLISILSLGDATANYTGGWTRKIEGFIFLFMLFQSLTRLTIAAMLSKLNQQEFYALQMTDEQLGKIELVILLVSGAVIYWWLRASRGIPTTISLSYFIITEITFLLRKVIVRK